MPTLLPRVVRQCAVALVLATLPIGLHAADRSRSLASPTAWSGAQDVAIYALGLTGVHYRFGGSSPVSGLDCSGLVRHVFQEVTGMNLPRTSKEMSALGAKVGVSDLMPGDLVFFNTRAPRTRTSASISATTASSMRPRKEAKSRSRRCRSRIG